MVSPVSAGRQSAALYTQAASAIDAAANNKTISRVEAKGLMKDLDKRAGSDGAIGRQDLRATRQMLRMAKSETPATAGASQPAVNTRRAADAGVSPDTDALIEAMRRLNDEAFQLHTQPQPEFVPSPSKRLPTTPSPNPAPVPALPTTPLFVQGGAGNDQIFGGTANDVLLGGDGNDDIDGDLGNDRIDGQGGNDSLYGEEGNDKLKGGAGNDTFVGGDEGNDKMNGGAGDDYFIDGAGNDMITGGAGNDKVAFSGFRDEYTITRLGANKFRVKHNGGEDGNNVVSNVEKLRFADRITLDTNRL
jgi:Ca2+-binding RTX toxin-like protein